MFYLEYIPSFQHSIGLLCQAQCELFHRRMTHTPCDYPLGYLDPQVYPLELTFHEIDKLHRSPHKIVFTLETICKLGVSQSHPNSGQLSINSVSTVTFTTTNQRIQKSVIQCYTYDFRMQICTGQRKDSQCEI